jgi:hypothetical protein
MSLRDNDPRSRDLGYLNRRRVSSQWSAFLAALSAELAVVADDAGAAAFMRAIGLRLARQHPVGKVVTLEELEGHLNTVLAGMDWGWTQLSAEDDHILITHGACPNVLEDDTRRMWPPLMAEILAGAYGAWLLEQGSPGAVTQCRDPLAAPLVFEHRI